MKIKDYLEQNQITLITEQGISMSGECCNFIFDFKDGFKCSVCLDFLNSGIMTNDDRDTFLMVYVNQQRLKWLQEQQKTKKKEKHGWLKANPALSYEYIQEVIVRSPFEITSKRLPDDVYPVMGNNFHTRDDAERVRNCLLDLVNKDGYVTVNDFYDILGIQGSYKSDSYGWERDWNSKSYMFSVIRDRDCYRITLPTPIEINKKYYQRKKEQEKEAKCVLPVFIVNECDIAGLQSGIQKRLDKNGSITVNDLCKLLSLPAYNHADDNRGWYSTNGFMCIMCGGRNRHSYELRTPDPIKFEDNKYEEAMKVVIEELKKDMAMKFLQQLIR